ncbi:MAG: helix-hairpin-helix domain-containing protein [Limnohabitans sp.]|nr:helix-hairpin-helix domain-containing protein [Limnohabitans sp.]
MFIALLFCWSTHANALEINQAKESDLDGLLGLGPAMTARVLKERNTKAFQSWPDLMHRVKGISKSTAHKLSKQGLKVEGKSYSP